MQQKRSGKQQSQGESKGRKVLGRKGKISQFTMTLKRY